MDQRTRLLLVRHGETVWNHRGRFQGFSDVPLSAEGRRQAALVRERFRGLALAACYASDLERARETAEIIVAPHGLPVRVCPALREINFGAWEGLTHAEIQARYPEEMRRWWGGAADIALPGGESFGQVRERAWNAVQDILARHAGGTVLVVAHGGSIRAILCAALELEPGKVWRLAQDNTAVNRLEFYPGFPPVLSLLNDTCHLEAQESSSRRAT